MVDSRYSGFSYPGDHFLRHQAFGSRGGNQVHLVGARGRHKNVRVLYPRLFQHEDGGGVARDRSHVKGKIHLFHAYRIPLDHRHVVVFYGEQTGQMKTDAPAPCNAYVHHTIPVCSGPCEMGIIL